MSIVQIAVGINAVSGVQGVVPGHSGRCCGAAGRYRGAARWFCKAGLKASPWCCRALLRCLQGGSAGLRGVVPKRFVKNPLTEVRRMQMLHQTRRNRRVW